MPLIALASAGRLPEAIEEFRTALQLKPQLVEARGRGDGERLFDHRIDVALELVNSIAHFILLILGFLTIMQSCFRMKEG